MCNSKKDSRKEEIRIGDRVKIILPGAKHFGKTGTVINPIYYVRLLPGEYVVKINGTGNTNYLYAKDGIEKIKVEPKIRVGSKVTPVTPAGVCLGHKATTGKYKEDYHVPCVFSGIGTVLFRKTVTIDYDSWPDGYVGLGKVKYTSCLIQCKDGVGWAGEGSLMLAE